MVDALEGFIRTIAVGWWQLRNLRIADDINLTAVSKGELANLMSRLDLTLRRYDMDISNEKVVITSNKVETLHYE